MRTSRRHDAHKLVPKVRKAAPFQGHRANVCQLLLIYVYKYLNTNLTLILNLGLNKILKLKLSCHSMGDLQKCVPTRIGIPETHTQSSSHILWVENLLGKMLKMTFIWRHFSAGTFEATRLHPLHNPSTHTHTNTHTQLGVATFSQTSVFFYKGPLIWSDLGAEQGWCWATLQPDLRDVKTVFLLRLLWSDIKYLQRKTQQKDDKETKRRRRHCH